MQPKVLVAPAPLKEIEHVYGPVLRGAGVEMVFPTRNVQMTEDELLAQLPGAAASLAGSEPYTRAVIEKAAAAGLSVIARAGVGYDGVDVAAATDHGVAVTITPGTNHDAVAEHTFMLLLALAKNLITQHTAIQKGQWVRRANQPLRGRTLGVVGFGRTGKAVALRGQAFGMPVIAFDPFADKDFAAKHHIPLVELNDLLKQSDVVTLHMPMLPGTKHIINAESLGLMKKTAYLINTARGGVVNEPALYDALKNNRLAGAGLDVFDEEPPQPDNPLLQLDNVVMTAHTAGVDVQSRDDMARAAAEAIAKMLAGEWPTGWVVNQEVETKWRARAKK
ncbi:phosphoglycerate dehydrogenase [Fimbriiglobus ruber]|uniref:D-3-phosphoglycerate dehydrogenase n=1 Tax=Fimbriiglobus ruber TaxID=1908690 RepID=A0A225DKF3_9BACT|nr:phosphoglycerate dehydrogenase [Fimbriiglobus ruber]OWK36637.1 D-3-phosphoglycerate dehydrogenase [Fimbriiglobus ruber]